MVDVNHGSIWLILLSLRARGWSALARWDCRTAKSGGGRDAIVAEAAEGLARILFETMENLDPSEGGPINWEHALEQERQFCLSCIGRLLLLGSRDLELCLAEGASKDGI
jgi:hypothetical protein